MEDHGDEFKVGALVDSTPLLGDGSALRSRSDHDGYLFFKQLLPQDAVLAVRGDILKVVEAHGWRAPGHDPLDGSIDVAAINRVPASEMRTDIGVSLAAYCATQKLEGVHRLPHHEKLLQLYRTLFKAEVLAHPRHIVRMITPHQCMRPTPQHQDFPLIQGTQQTWTCWFPLGDCPRALGGLAVLEGSHTHGNFPIREAEGAGGFASQLCPGEGKQWRSTDYQTGDVLTFPSWTVHRALPCQVKDQIRLSMDIRYQSALEIINERSLKPHCPLEWEEIYQGWKQSDLKYYWRRFEQKLSPWDEKLRQPRQRIC